MPKALKNIERDYVKENWAVLDMKFFDKKEHDKAIKLMHIYEKQLLDSGYKFTKTDDEEKIPGVSQSGSKVYVYNHVFDKKEKRAIVFRHIGNDQYSVFKGGYHVMLIMPYNVKEGYI